MTEGQVAALEQLRDVAALDGPLAIVEVREPREGSPNLVVDVSVFCGDLEHRPDGLPLRSRERLLISVPPGFPFEPPSVNTAHIRFAGYPHVQWGKHPCLYQAPSTEWSSADGMYGFVDRLGRWLEQAARAELDPAGAALHPPVAYAKTGPYRMVIPRADTPTVTNEAWFGYAHLSKPTEWRVDLTGWSPIRSDETPSGVAAAILLAQPMPFEFPENVGDLIASLSDRGVPQRLLLLTLQCALLRNEEAEPLYVVIGTPMRGIAGSSDLKQHLTAWYVDPVVVKILRFALNRYDPDPAFAEIGEDAERAVLEWARSAPVVWCNVCEDRPEIVTRRDHGSRVSWFRGRCVSIWGCGALGGPIAEFLARAGVQKLILHDNNTVRPGLLTRQPYDDADLGRFKAEALANRLQRERPGIEVDVRKVNILRDPLDSEDWTDGADVLIDTTASNAVRSKLELRRRENGKRKTPIVSMMVGHEADNGVVVVVPPGYAGGPADALRGAKLFACGRATLRDFADEFWPKDRHIIFQPEPGCSDPTFVGSAADAAALAGLMLNLAAEALHDETSEATAAFVAHPKLAFPERSTGASFRLAPDVVIVDPGSGYEIRMAPGAWADIEAWAKRSSRTSGPRVETGGLLFGERDDASRVIWVSEVTGPPSDSQASEHGFICGVSGTEVASKEKRERSRDSVTYIGMWHTHPEGAPLPSGTDIGAMEHLVARVKESPSKLLLLIVGGSRGHRLTGAFVFKKSDFETLRSQGEARRLCAITPHRIVGRKHRIGLALSGGGSRAIAFHLGCLRALHDRGILDQVQLISAVSGGSVIAGMYAYRHDSFEAFDARVVALLRQGLTASIVRRSLLSPRIIGSLLTVLGPGAAAVGAVVTRTLLGIVSRLLPHDSRLAPSKIERIQPPLRRWTSRTVAFEDVLRDRLFGDVKVSNPRIEGVDIVFNACELRTGTAFRFGSRESASWRFGKLPDNDVRVSFAVAASAAYPAVLPAIDQALTFSGKNGDQKTERVIITDGGVYDNLGLSCLAPGRSPEFSSNVFSPDYIVCCDAGPGQFGDHVYPFWWPSRMKRSFETTFRRGLSSSYAALHEWAASGKIRGFALVYLGQQDERLPYIPSDLVRREAVAAYPTNFSSMPATDIERLATRGEQLARLLISQHLSDV